MRIRVVVIDDEKPARSRLRRLLADHPEFEIVGEAGDVDAAVALLEATRPDAAFLDVRIPGGDGFDVLARSDHKPRVVFTTAYDEYAVRAFAVHSVDYLLKPFDRDRFAEALSRLRVPEGEPAGVAPDRILRLLDAIRAEIGSPPAEPGGPDEISAPAESRPFRLTARRGAKIVLLDPVEVLWFEADDTIVYARTAESRYLVDRPLAELERLLGARFFRSHRSVLLNLAHVGEIVPGDGGTYRVVLRDPARSTVPLSRRQAQKLREILKW